MASNEELIKIKENYLKILYKQYEALHSQKIQSLNEADKISIQESINNLEKEIKKVDEDIGKLRLSNINDNNSFKQRIYSLAWEEKLHRIDFLNSKKILKNVLDQLDNNEAEEVIFLIQKNISMKGQLLIKHIEFLLQEIGTWNSPCKFEFQKHQQVNNIDFLNFLAIRFEVQACSDPDNIQKCIDNIVDKICGSLFGGDILFFQIDIYHLEPHNDFLEWFVQFWCHLVEKVSVIRNDYRFIKLVAVIAVSGLIPETCLKSSLYCTPEEFDGKKIIKLPLHNWTDKEICEWLLRHSGLNASHIGLKPQDIQQMAKAIYEITEGRPSEVYNELMEEMGKRISSGMR